MKKTKQRQAVAVNSGNNGNTGGVNNGESKTIRNAKIISALVERGYINNEMIGNSNVNESLRDQLGRAFNDPKHTTLYESFGYEKQITYDQMQSAYSRNGFVKGTINLLANLAFTSNPKVIEGDENEEQTEQTPIDKEIAAFCKRLKLFRTYKDCTRRRSVGHYSAMILQIADNKNFDQPVDNISPEDIVGVFPVWEHQITPDGFIEDQKSVNYGKPLKWSYSGYDYQYTTSKSNAPTKTISIHSDRVIYFGDIYSQGTTSSASNLMAQAGFNAYKTLEKIVGAGGEGLYKNAARHIAQSFGKDTSINDIASMLGVEPSEIGDALNDVTKDINSNFDAGLFGKEVSYDVLSTSLTDMDKAFNNALMEWCASFNLPSALVVGKQTGERASTEDANQGYMTATAYREDTLTPEIEEIFSHFAGLGLWKGIEKTVVWDSLFEMSNKDKIDTAHKMAVTNKDSIATGGDVYTVEEIRVAGGYEADSDDLDAIDIDELDTDIDTDVDS